MVNKILIKKDISSGKGKIFPRGDSSYPLPFKNYLLELFLINMTR